MSEISKQIKNWSKKHKWLTDLAADIDRVEGLIASESNAQARLAKISEDIDKQQSKLDKLIDGINVQEQAIIKAAADNDERQKTSVREAAEAISSAKSRAAEIDASAKASAEAITSAAQSRVDASNVAVKSAQEQIFIEQERIKEAKAEYTEVIKAIAAAKAMAAEAMRQVAG